MGIWISYLRANGPTLLLLTLFLSLNQALAAADRPNILFAFADDWGRYAGAYARLEPGGPADLAVTPHFDELAREGVLFRNAFVNAPSCTPCRSSLLSGQFFWRTGRGAILSGAVWDSQIPTYPLLLQRAGYHIGHSCKVWSPGKPANAPYGGSATAYNSAGRRFNSFSQTVSRAADPMSMRSELYREVRENFRNFLEDRGEDQPFCYWFGPTNCHRKWTRGSGRKLWGLNPDRLEGKLPAFLPDVPVVREDFADYLGEVQAFDAALGVLLEELRRNGELESTIIVVSGDHGIPGIPRGKCNLYDLGTRVPLVVRYPERFPGGRVVDDFVTLPDLAPTFLQAAGESIPEPMTARSLIPVLESASVGQVDPNRDHAVFGRERHVSGARTGSLPYPQRAIRTARYLLIRNFKPDRWPMGTAPGFGEPDGPFASTQDLTNSTFKAFADLDASPTKAWIIDHRQDADHDQYFDFAFGRRPGIEFFDLRDDPDQLVNLAEDPRYAEDLETLHDRLMQILKSTDDPRVRGDGSTFDEPPFSTPAEPGKFRRPS